MTEPITYYLLPKQAEFLFGMDKDKVKEMQKADTYKDISLYQGGVGSGKTFCGSLRGLLYALTWDGCRGLVGALSQDLLDNTTKKTYLDHLELLGMKEGVHWWYADRQQQIVFKNGSVIRFKTLSDWRTLMSEQFTWIEFEEASFIDEVTFKNLMTRLREIKRPHWRNYFHSMFLHSNPQGKRGWIYRLFINPKTKIPYYRYVTASSRENYHLGDTYIELLQDLYSQEEFEQMVEGRDIDTDNKVAFPQFDEEKNVTDVKYNERAPLILSCDFNFNPMCWYLMQEYDGKWYVLTELIGQNVTTKEMCAKVQSTISQYNTKRLIIMGDAHGRDRKTNGSDYTVMIQHFDLAGYNVELRVQKNNPLIKDRLSILRAYLRNAKGERRLFVDKSCKKLIYNLSEAENDLAKAGLKMPTDKDIKNDPSKLFLIHPIDAVSYPIYYLSRLRQMSGESTEL